MIGVFGMDTRPKRSSDPKARLSSTEGGTAYKGRTLGMKGGALYDIQEGWSREVPRNCMVRCCPPGESPMALSTPDGVGEGVFGVTIN